MFLKNASTKNVQILNFNNLEHMKQFAQQIKWNMLIYVLFKRYVNIFIGSHMMISIIYIQGESKKNRDYRCFGQIFKNFVLFGFWA